MTILPKAGEFITGVCHPRKRTDLIKEAGIKYVRIDVPFPYENGKHGVLREAYREFRHTIKKHNDEGLRSMCVSPNPKAFAEFGVDFNDSGWFDKVREVCEFIGSDLKTYKPGWQVSNELNIFHFRIPITLEQVPQFIAAGIEGIKRGDPGAVCGYNTAGLGDAEVVTMVHAIQSYNCGEDFFGLDTYKGTWSDGEPDIMIAEIDEAYELTKLPVLVQEFGFASAGTIFTMDDVQKYLEGMGFQSPQEVMDNPRDFLDVAPYHISEVILKSPEEDWGKNIRIQIPHLLKKWPGGSKIYRHTPEGQAAFFDEVLGKMLAHPQVCGAIIYCWNDDTRCWNCRAKDCCCETAWGICYNNEEPKPVYEIVKKHFTGIPG
jgi:hypothetical protein